jgi:hypothetical protein
MDGFKGGNLVEMFMFAMLLVQYSWAMTWQKVAASITR